MYGTGHSKCHGATRVVCFQFKVSRSCVQFWYILMDRILRYDISLLGGHSLMGTLSITTLPHTNNAFSSRSNIHTPF